MSLLGILCFLFVFGVFTGFIINSGFLFTLAFIVAAVIFIKYIVFEMRKKSIMPFVTGIIFIIVCFSGILYGYSSKNVFSEYELFYNEDVAIKGKVVYIASDNSFFDVNVRFISNGKNSCENCKKVRVYNYDDFNVEICDVLALTGALKQYNDARYYGDYNSRMSNMSDGIFGYITPEKIEKKFNYQGFFDLAWFGHRIRTFIFNRVDTSFAGDESAFLKALLAGDRRNISEETVNNLQISGLSHIIAVSGLHLSVFISIFCGWFYIFGKRYYSLIAVILTVALYSVVIGGSPSVLRAGLMIIISLIISNFAIRNSQLTNLMISSAVLCALNPFLTQNIGFQLSAASVFGLLIFTKNSKNKLISTASVLFVISPICAYYFNSVSLGSIFANIIIAPIIAVLLPLGYLMCFIPFLKYIVAPLTSFTLFVINVFGNLRFLNLKVPSPSILYFAFHVALGTLLYFIVHKGGRRICLKISAVALMLLALTVYGGVYKSRFSFVKSFNGNTVIKISDNKVVVIGKYNENVIDGILGSENIKDIDVYILQDYYKYSISTLESISENYNIKSVFIPDNTYIKDEEKELLQKAAGNSEVKFYGESRFSFKDITVVTGDDIKILCNNVPLSTDGRNTCYIKDDKIMYME